MALKVCLGREATVFDPVPIPFANEHRPVIVSVYGPVSTIFLREGGIPIRGVEARISFASFIKNSLGFSKDILKTVYTDIFF